MERKYNYIYKQLVDDEYDVIGHIAYSIYKSNKIEFIEKFKEEHNGLPPTEEELMSFHDVSCTTSSINLYQTKAEIILSDFLDEVLEEIRDDVEHDYINNHNAHLKSIIEPLVPKKSKQFFQSLLASLLGAFIFALIVAAFAFITSYNHSDNSVNLEQKAEEALLDQSPSVVEFPENTSEENIE